MSRAFKVADAAGARLLKDPRRRKLLLSLVNQEQSLKDVAGATGIALNLAHYHVAQLEAHGLVEVTREQKRAGRPIRFYRSKYRSYFVSNALLPGRPAERLQRKLESALQHARDLSGGGVLFDTDDHGRPRMREVDGEGPGPLELLKQLRLSNADAKALIADLAQVIRKYDERRTRSGGAWTIRVALAQFGP